MKYEHTIELIPVIEVEPYHFSKVEYFSPQVTIAEDPAAWESFNQKCYLDAGLNKMNAVKPGNWLFEANRLSTDQLRIIFEELFTRRFETPEAIREMLRDMPEYAPLIAGGFMLKVNGEIISLPGCCAGLESIQDWCIPRNDPSTKFCEIWVGHDENGSIRYNRVEKEIQLAINDSILYSISYRQYLGIVESALELLYMFAATLGEALNEVLSIDNGDELARIMIFRE